jgi:hypothetical protein
MIGLNRQLDHGPLMLCGYLVDDLLQAMAYRANEHLAPPLGAPDDVVHDKVYAMLLVLIVHVDSKAWNNTGRKPERPFIPRLKPGAFWPHFCKAEPESASAIFAPRGRAGNRGGLQGGDNREMAPCPLALVPALAGEHP